MAMKQSDIATATALLLAGYLYSNSGDAQFTENQHLSHAIAGMRKELADWSENLEPADGSGIDVNAYESDALSVDIVAGQFDVPRTPYNLISAALTLVSEAIDLNGPDVIRDLRDRISTLYPGEWLASVKGEPYKAPEPRPHRDRSFLSMG